MEFLKEMADDFLQRKKLWLLPILIFTDLFGVLLVFTDVKALAPFIYKIFSLFVKCIAKF